MASINAQSYSTIAGELLKVEIWLFFPIMIDYTSLHGILIFTQGYGTMTCDTNVDIKFSAQVTFRE
jgi:hypothetical protein